MNNKRILIIVNVDWFFMSHRLPIALEALERGYSVTIASRFTVHKAELVSMGFGVAEVPFSRSGRGIFGEFNTIRALKTIVDEVQPDLVHAVTIKPVLYTGLVLKSVTRDIPFLAAISGLGYVFTANTFRSNLTKTIASILYKIALSQKFKMVIFQNSSDERILTAVAKLKSSDKILIKGSGADLSVYDYRPENTSSPVKVVMACRLLVEKGVYQYIDAARTVKEQYPSVEFLLVGTPDLENPNTIKQMEIDTWVSQGLINYLGHRNDIADVFADANIICLPSFYGEGVPKVLIEAAACGRAIITTDSPGCRDAVIEGVTGLTVPTRDARLLATAILKLVEQPDLRVVMGAKARGFAEKEFDVNSVVNKHLVIYKNLLSSSEQ